MRQQLSGGKRAAKSPPRPHRTTKRRRPNPRLAKIHRNYTVEEVASLYGVHKNTVRQWIKQGLKVIDDRRPMLIMGQDLVDFLLSRRQRNKRPCGPGEIYCVKCRDPMEPAENMVDYQKLTDTLGNLVGICPTCGTLMYRRVSLVQLPQIQAHLDVTITEGLRRINETPTPSVNSDFKKDDRQWLDIIPKTSV